MINPAGGSTIAEGQATTITWRDELTNLGTGGTDTIELLQGTSVVLSFPALDTGSYSWTPSVSLAAGQYQIKINPHRYHQYHRHGPDI